MTADVRGQQPLVPVPSGRAYRVSSAQEAAMITPALAQELARVLESFAGGAGFDESRPVGVFFKPGIFGHHQVGRAADIYGVGGIGLNRWKARWDDVMRRASGGGGLDDSVVDAERATNLGWRLYKTMATEGRWSQPYGYPIQLFGPWTRTEGPWKYISDRLLVAHLDHIHVAK
jgi:hypothetical protein